MERTRYVRHVETELMHYRLGWLVAIGFGLIAIGMTGIYAPYYSGFSLQSLIGSFFLLSGGMFVADAVKSRHEGRFVPELLIALLYLLFALLVGFASGKPHALTLFIGIFFGLEGVLKIYLSLGLRPGLDWTWVLMSGVISVIISAAVWGIPFGSPLVSVMVGIDLMHSGLTTMAVARAMRKKLEKRQELCFGDLCFSEQ